MDGIPLEPTDPLAQLVRERTLAALRERLFDAPSCARRARYELRRRLGRGGFGTVYRAWDHQLHRDVAIKLLHLSDDSNRVVTDELAAEARAIAHVQHPNVVRVFDVGRADDGKLGMPRGETADIYMVMELLEGEPLGEWLRRKPPAVEILRVLIDAGRGLTACHAAGLVHRDLKPANIVVTDGVAQLVDFGLATLALEGLDDTAPGDEGAAIAPVAGTPAYLAPELIEGAAPDHRADQYALAVTAAEALLGQRMFPDVDLFALALAKHRPIRPVELRRRGMPPAVASVLARAMQPAPQRRYRNTAAFVDALESSLGRLGKRPPITHTLVVSTIALVGLAAAVPGAAEDRAACLDQADVRTRTWAEPEARVVASRAPRGDGKPIEDRLGRFTQQWQETWSDSCGTVDGESTRSCLAQHADSFDEALALLVREGEGEGKGKGDRALQIIAAAGDPTECGPSPVGAVELRDLQLGTALRRARMLQGAGDSRRALDEALTTLDAAVSEGRERIAAEARFMVGVAQVAVGDIDAGRHNIEEAYYAATASRHGSLARSAAIRMVAVAAHHAFDEEAADFWARQAETAMARPPLASYAERGALGYNLGLLHRSRGRVDHAQEAFAAAAEWFEAADRPAEVLTATAALGSIALDRGDAERSRALLERAIVQLEPMLGVDHPELAKLLVALGNAQRASGDRDIARLTLQRALDIATRGGTEITRGLAAMNLAVLAFDRGRYAEAASAQREALDALLRTQPDNHPYVSAARDNLGVMLRMQGAPDEACPLHARALDDRRHTGTVRDVLVSTNNLARCRIAQARFEEAEDLLDTAKARAEVELADDDTELAEIYTSFGVLAQARGRPGEAIVALETARSLWSRHSGPELSRAEGLEILAWALAATGGEPESISALESAARREYAALGHDVAETR